MQGAYTTGPWRLARRDFSPRLTAESSQACVNAHYTGELLPGDRMLEIPEEYNNGNQRVVLQEPLVDVVELVARIRLDQLRLELRLQERFREQSAAA